MRLHGIHDPMLDHPGWRQGDTAAIARNFFRLRFDIMYPQTMYNGPPPNYVELELQIVPFIVATAYKVFGIHEIFGRIVVLAFSLGTVVTIAFFGRWLFNSTLAGIAAAFFYAIFPGSVYYGRTFTPDCAMVFFLTAALYATSRYIAEAEGPAPYALAGSTLLLTLAYLAKPVAVLAAAPLLGMMGERARAHRAFPALGAATLLVVPILVLVVYDRRIASYAEWHWASGITRLHVLPALQASLTSAAALGAKLTNFRTVVAMLRVTMLGDISFWLAIAGFVALPWVAARTKALLWGWLIGGLIYLYVVVTVERVDYYLYPLLPLCALVIAGPLARFVAGLREADIATPARLALLATVPLICITALLFGRVPIAPYYGYNKDAYRNAVALDYALPKDAVIVMGHYGPDVQYYIDRFGWEEDPIIWTSFDEESAIRKGARYFVAIEDNRLRNNMELCAWLARFPRLAYAGAWPVYETDPAKVSPKAERFWREFRNAERSGAGRAFLDANGLCRLAPS
ncbi:MAG: glycosyltransferase family 39 protein [Candidatus Eremiobacteraeota bacterium]|nr:glycosyltransferase family 39 protein [Candidatus Eremiobacteraeota bacterium]